jgi:hypothetical protein
MLYSIIEDLKEGGVYDVACYKYARPLLVLCDVERAYSQSKSVTIDADLRYAT